MSEWKRAVVPLAGVVSLALALAGPAFGQADSAGSVVPEPASLVLMGLGAAGFMLKRWLKSR